MRLVLKLKNDPQAADIIHILDQAIFFDNINETIFDFWKSVTSKENVEDFMMEYADYLDRREEKEKDD